MVEGGEEGPSDTVARVREVADYIRVSKERMLSLETGVLALREKTRRDLQLAQSRVDEAEARIAVEAARANAAEQRCRELEAKLSELDAVIRQELLAAVDNEPERPKAELRLLGRAIEPSSEPANGASDVGEPPSRRRVAFDDM
jgi:ABC-type phosphate transport system auxiliary subunit